MAQQAQLLQAQETFNKGLNHLTTALTTAGVKDAIQVPYLKPLLSCNLANKTEVDNFEKQYSSVERDKFIEIAERLGKINGLFYDIASMTVRNFRVEVPVNKKIAVSTERTKIVASCLKFTKALLERNSSIDLKFLQATQALCSSVASVTRAPDLDAYVDELFSNIKNFEAVLETSPMHYLYAAGRALVGALTCFVSALVFILGLTPPGLLFTAIAQATSKETPAPGFLDSGLFGASKQLWNYGTQKITSGPTLFQREQASQHAAELDSFAQKVKAVPKP